MQKIHVWEKGYIWNLCENGIYLASIMNNSRVICDEVIESYDEEIKTIPTNFNVEKPVKHRVFVFYLNFY